MKFEDASVGDIVIGNASEWKYEILHLHPRTKTAFAATDHDTHRISDWEHYTKNVPKFEIGKWYKHKSIYYPEMFKVVEIYHEETITIYQDGGAGGGWFIQVLYIGNDASNYEEVEDVRLN